MLSKLALKNYHSSLQNHCSLLHMGDLKKITLVEFTITSGQMNNKTVKDYTAFLQSIKLDD